jgi:hypothetical protein
MKCPKCKKDLYLEFPKNDTWHPCNYYKCPECLSHNRNRLLYLLLKDRNNGYTLEYSPVRILQEFVDKSADFPPRHSHTTEVIMADINDDLTNSQFKDNEFDTVICSHILDSILDDDKAIKELHRITKDTALVSVPIFEIPETIEYGEIKEGNFGHYRKPNIDYFNKLKIFKNVEIINGSDFKNSNLYGLEGEYVAICKK